MSFHPSCEEAIVSRASTPQMRALGIAPRRQSPSFFVMTFLALSLSLLEPTFESSASSAGILQDSDLHNHPHALFLFLEPPPWQPQNTSSLYDSHQESGQIFSKQKSQKVLQSGKQKTLKAVLQECFVNFLISRCQLESLQNRRAAAGSVSSGWCWCLGSGCEGIEIVAG